MEVDEIWGYVFKKEGHKSEEDGAEIGDAYCFIGMERTTKLVLAYHLGKRTAKSTDDLSANWPMPRPDDRYQLTSDGFKPYVSAVKMILRDRVDFAQLVKVYGAPRDGEQRYSRRRLWILSHMKSWADQSETEFARSTSNGKI